MTGGLEQWATWREINAQPAIWRDWGNALDVVALREWISGLGLREVWFCGAGTSAYIGDILAAGLEGQGQFRSIPTTDIVSRPKTFLAGRAPLVVQFGRSGNSAETIGLLDALDALAPDAPRLNITCNRDGALARRIGRGRSVILPAETHDAGFAMTSSFSTMLLTAMAIFAPEGTTPFAAMADALQSALPSFLTMAEQAPTPERIVFLGSGPLAFAAREAALKVMELAAGQIPALWDSPLGFRHGPKSFVTPGTQIVLFASQQDHAALYEADLAAELATQFPASPLTVVDARQFGAAAPSDLWAAPLHVALAQVLAVVWSARLGLHVDDPFVGRGTLSRVVSGVRLYPVVP
ncbi:MAG: SIS domain-containing protein [Rhodobacteraceae bacterium]|nr:SIS domain-containing protein [Paracoccaceae bacterium]MCF8520976.1 SIS domain-containing protein [Paracoccaceae bacterium]